MDFYPLVSNEERILCDQYYFMCMRNALFNVRMLKLYCELDFTN